jgi:hypothetical protein
VKRILVQGLDKEGPHLSASLPPATTFARSVNELVGVLAEEAGAWN